MRGRVIRAVFGKELRETLRDRRSLAIMFGIPLLLYPLVTMGVATLTISRQRSMNQQIYSVAVTNADGAGQFTQALLARDSGVLVVQPGDARAALARRGVDAVLELPTQLDEKARLGEPLSIQILIDRSRTESGVLEKKLRTIIGDYEKAVIRQRLVSRNLPESIVQPIEAKTEDVASADQRLGRILSAALPIILLLTGMLGAFFPALNATTTEREAGTLEALLVTPATKMELLLAKGAMVLLASLATAALNLTSMSLVMWRALSGDAAMGALTVKFSTLLLAFVAVIPALILFATLTMIVGLMARSFREANAYATPVMLVPMLAMIATITEPAATPALLVTPVLNTTLVLRDVLTGRATAGGFALAFVSSCLYAGLLISLAARMFTSEQLVNPTWEPLSLRGLRRAGRGDRPRRLPAIDEALALFAVVLLLVFYISPSLARFGLGTLVAVNQIALIALPALLAGYLLRYDWRATFSFRPASWPAYAGAMLIGAGLPLVVNLLMMLQNRVWPAGAEQIRQQAQLILPSLLSHPILTIFGIAASAGVCEELLFRGPIQSALSRRGAMWPAILTSGLFFAALHLDVHGLPIRWLIALFLGWMVFRGGSIFPAMVMHGVYDAASLTFNWLAIRGKTVNDAIDLQTRSIGQSIDAQTLLITAVGAALVTAGWWLCRRSFARAQAS